MKFLQIRKKKMKFSPGTGLRGQPAATVAQADARPRRTARACGPGVGGTRAAQAGGAADGPASRPTRGAGATALYIYNPDFP